MLLAFIFAVGVFVITYLQPYTYKSTATVIFTRSELRLSLADDFQTINDNRDTNARLTALITIAQSDAIAQKLFEQFSEQLKPEIEDFEAVKQWVPTRRNSRLITNYPGQQSAN